MLVPLDNDARIKIGKAVQKARNEMGLTRDALIGSIGDAYISERTLKRIEYGEKGVSWEKISLVLRALRIDVGTYEDIQKYIADRSVDAFLALNSFHTDLGGSDNYWRDLFIYLPLICPLKLADMLYRIEVPSISREDYVAEQLHRLFQTIPDSPAKRFAGLVIQNLSVEARNAYYYKGTSPSGKDDYNSDIYQAEGCKDYMEAWENMVVFLNSTEFFRQGVMRLYSNRRLDTHD